MGAPPWPVALEPRPRSQPTAADRYVRYEFGDREATWLVSSAEPRRKAEPEPRDAEDEGGVFQRLTRAIASFI
jgi:hypothetical protein